MSHELRTPLNAIINFSKFLKKGIPGPINEEQGQLIGGIADSGQHLLNLINDVLDMSKIESGSLSLYVESDLDLHQIIEAALQYTRPLLADKPVELQENIPVHLPTLTGDRKRLLQVFLNLLSNACKFTEKGFVKICVQNENDHLLISIEDTGTGIALEDSKDVFTAFKQTESGLRQGGNGTGLGMPISQKLVEAHEGRIWFESKVGVGTTFYVHLPLQTKLTAERRKQSA
jgi:signal transduction histidine kinase